jgi:hypothetical protein
MRQCYIDNGRHGCDGKRTNKGRIRYGCWACPYLDAGGGDTGETDGSIGGSGQAGRKGSP